MSLHFYDSTLLQHLHNLQETQELKFEDYYENAIERSTLRQCYPQLIMIAYRIDGCKVMPDFYRQPNKFLMLIALASNMLSGVNKEE